MIVEETTLVIFEDVATKEEAIILQESFSGEVNFLGAVYAVRERITERFSGPVVFKHEQPRVTLRLQRCIPYKPLSSVI